MKPIWFLMAITIQQKFHTKIHFSYINKPTGVTRQKAKSINALSNKIMHVTIQNTLERENALLTSV